MKRNVINLNVTLFAKMTACPIRPHRMIPVVRSWAMEQRAFSSNSFKCALSLPHETHCAGVFQQVRKYVPDSPIESECWHCKKQCTNRMICSACGHLQDVDMRVNFFELMEIPERFELEQQKLTKRFRQLQTLVHPDKFSNKSSREQINSTEWSSLLNKAYKTLSTPIERGEYILKLHGEDLPQDNSSLNKEFLMHMMERNEEVEEADDSTTLRQLNEKIINEINEKVAKLNKQFEKQQVHEAKLTLVEMKYLLSIQNSIKNKIQSIGD